MVGAVSWTRVTGTPTTTALGVMASKPKPTSSSVTRNQSARKGIAVKSSMKLLGLVLVASMLTTMATAEPPPPVPEGGLIHLDRDDDCTDPVTGLEGTCFYSRDLRGNHYMAFYTDNNLCMYITQKIDGKDVEIWRRGADV